MPQFSEMCKDIHVLFYNKKIKKKKQGWADCLEHPYMYN